MRGIKKLKNVYIATYISLGVMTAMTTMGTFTAGDMSEKVIAGLIENTNNDIIEVCSHIECKYIEIAGVMYSFDQTELSIEPLNETSNELPLLDKLMLTKHHTEGYDGIVYTSDGTELLSYLNDFLVVGIALYTIFGIFMWKSIKESLMDDVSDATDVVNSEARLKALIISTAHHEMLTPIAAIRASVDTLFTAVQIPKDKLKSMDIMLSNIQRLEAVLEQMSSTRTISKASKATYLDIITKTLNTLKVLYMDSRFEYDVVSKDSLESICSHKLQPGTIANILNNLFKNSLEAGATLIKVVPVIKDTLVELYIIDNGSGVSEAMAGKDIFKLGASSKTGDHSLIQATRLIRSNTVSRGNGLSLSRTIAESCGGGLWLEKTNTKGTMFKLVLPYSKKEQS